MKALILFSVLAMLATLHPQVPIEQPVPVGTEEGATDEIENVTEDDGIQSDDHTIDRDGMRRIHGAASAGARARARATASNSR